LCFDPFCDGSPFVDREVFGIKEETLSESHSNTFFLEKDMIEEKSSPSAIVATMVTLLKWRFVKPNQRCK